MRMRQSQCQVVLSVAGFFSIVLLVLFGAASAAAQSVASGTIEGTVVDQTGAVISGANVEINNVLTGYRQSSKTDANGTFRFANIPFNNYELSAVRTGMKTTTQSVAVRSMVPVGAKLELAVAGAAAG